MKAIIKSQYTAPAMQVLDLQVKARLCDPSTPSRYWNYIDDFVSPDTESGWDRPDYGDVIEF